MQGGMGRGESSRVWQQRADSLEEEGLVLQRLQVLHAEADLEGVGLSTSAAEERNCAPTGPGDCSADGGDCPQVAIGPYIVVAAEGGGSAPPGYQPTPRRRGEDGVPRRWELSLPGKGR